MAPEKFGRASGKSLVFSHACDSDFVDASLRPCGALTGSMKTDERHY